MRPQDCGITLTGNIVERLVEVAGDSRAVLALEMDVFAVAQLELAHQGVVRVRDLRQLAAWDCEKLVGAVDGRDLRQDSSSGSQGIVAGHQSAADRTSDFASRCWNTAEILRPIVVSDEINRLPVGRKARRDAHPVERPRQDLGLAAGRRCYGDVLGGVVK